MRDLTINTRLVRGKNYGVNNLYNLALYDCCLVLVSIIHKK